MVKNIVYSCVVIFVLGAIALILSFNDANAIEYNYVQIDSIATLEMLTNKNNAVVGVNYVNYQCELALAGHNLVGKNIGVAIQEFLRLCVDIDLIDVSSQDNCIKINVVENYSHLLECEVYLQVSEFIKSNQIFAVLIEENKIVDFQRQAKDNEMTTTKLTLATSLANCTDMEWSDICKLTEKQIVKMLSEIYRNNSLYYTNDDLYLECEQSELAEINEYKVVTMLQDENQNYADEYSEYIKMMYAEQVRDYYNLRELRIIKKQNNAYA